MRRASRGRPAAGGVDRSAVPSYEMPVMRTEVGPAGFWLRFLLGYVLAWGALAGLGGFDATGRWGVPILIGVAATVIAVETFVFGSPLRTAVSFLGLGRARLRSLVPAAVASGLVLLVYPITTAVTGAHFVLVDDWPWILIGLFAFHGLAEEIVWRGYVFRRLSEGRSFRAAVIWTMPFVAASHLPILVTSGPVVAIGALAVAAVTSIPFSHLYVIGRRTVWGPALVHTAIDTFKLVIVPAAATRSFFPLLIVFSLLAPLVVLAVPRNRRG